MKVMFFANHSDVTGANLSLAALIKNLETKQVECFVVLSGPGPIETILKEKKINYQIIRTFQRVFPMEDTKHPIRMGKHILKACLTRLNENKAYVLMKNWKPDIVHLNTVSANLGFKSAKRLNIPVVWHIREFVHEDHGYTFLNEQSAYRELEKARKIIAISDSVYDKFHRLMPRADMVRIYNGVDTKAFYDEGHRPFAGDSIVLTLAGRIKPSKGIEEALEAIHILKEREIAGKRTVLQIAGSFYENSYKEELQKYIDDHGLNDCVRFIGFQKNMGNVWRKTDIALICSKAEAFGRVTVEAMLCGALVIGADTMGTKELIRDKETGLLYSQGQVLSLADTCQFAIEHQKQCCQMVENAIQTTKTKFTAQENADQIFSVYKSILL